MRSKSINYIPFTKPRKTSNELNYINDVINSGKTWGGGSYSTYCTEWISRKIGVDKSLITTSATDALEMAALLIDIQPGDEVIMPSFTFVSTANSFVLRGGVPVFIDVDENTLNVDAKLLEAAINENTKAIVVMNYGGFSCDLDLVIQVANRYKLFVIEDAAQSLLASYKNKPLGTFGDLACFSFHGTKNISSGEGGALLVNNHRLVERADIIFEKGTNRSKYLHGEVDKYSWVDLGSSFLASEITCSYLWSQLQEAETITEYRIENWNSYHNYFRNICDEHNLKLMNPEKYSKHNGHLYYILMSSTEKKRNFISQMNQLGVQCASHYVPLHSSLGGIKYGKLGSRIDTTDRYWDKLVRLPMWSELGMPMEYILNAVKLSLESLH